MLDLVEVGLVVLVLVIVLLFVTNFVNILVVLMCM